MKLNFCDKFTCSSSKFQLKSAITYCIPWRYLQDKPWRIGIRIGHMNIGAGFASFHQAGRVSIVEKIDILGFDLKLCKIIVMSNYKIDEFYRLFRLHRDHPSMLLSLVVVDNHLECGSISVRVCKLQELYNWFIPFWSLFLNKLQILSWHGLLILFEHSFIYCLVTSACTFLHCSRLKWRMQ